MVCAAAVCVAGLESAALMLRFGGGRPSDTGYGWLAQLLGQAFESDFLGGLPAFFARFYELGSIGEALPFLGAAVLLNVLLALIIGGPVVALLSLFGRGPGVRLATWLLLLSPVIMHLASEATLPGVARSASPVRIAIGGAVVVLLWLLLLWPARRWGRFESASNLAAMALVVAGVALVLGGTAVGLASRETPTAPGSGPNILLISIDSLRADHLHSYGYERETSPHMDQLAEEGVLFRYAVAPTSWTLPSHLTMLTALPPNQHQVTGDLTRLRPEAVTMAEVLKERGYETAAFVSGPYLQAEYGFAQGFDLYDDYSAMVRMWNAHRKVTSPALVESVTGWIDEWDRNGRERPFFIFLHMWDVHYDYNAPEPYRKMFDPAYTGPATGEDFEGGSEVHPAMEPRDLEHIVALYDGEIRYTDEHVGRLVEHLRGRGVLDESVVAVTSDHGEEFFEHGSKGHRKALYDESVLVPLIIRYPKKLPGGEVVSNQVRLLDLAPTLLGLADVEAPKEFGMSQGNPEDFGRDVTGDAPPPPLAYGVLSWFLGSVRTNDWKLVVRVEGDPEPELYSLADDPGETVNLAGQQGERLDFLYQRLMAFRKSGEGRRLAEPMEVDREHMTALKTLGYVTEYFEEALRVNPEMLQPAPGSQIGHETLTFEWSPVEGAEYYYLKVGSNFDDGNIYAANEGKRTRATVTDIPVDGRRLHVRLLIRIGEELVHKDFVYPTGKDHLPCVGTVELTNLSGGGMIFAVGDGFRVEVAGPANEVVGVVAERDGEDAGAVFGKTDGEGRYVIEGVMKEDQRGQWQQRWLVGGRCVEPAFEFEVGDGK